MQKFFAVVAAFVLLLAATHAVMADEATEVAKVAQPAEPEAPPAAEPATQEPATEFNYQSGDVLLPNKVATLHLGSKYRYLNPVETEKLLVAWGNPPGNETEGAVVPTGVDPMTDEGWAVILTYLDDGHVDDSDAAKIDYDDLLKGMQEGTSAANEERKQAGYPAMNLVGWAERPRYDSTNKKLYWAQELATEGREGNSLNYDVRVLGREGVLSMNAVASMDQLGQIRADMQPLLAIAEFNPGYRYAEFNAKTDRLAEYGLGALIAGGVAAKMGLFGKLAALLLAGKKFIVFILIGIAALARKFFSRKNDSDGQATS